MAAREWVSVNLESPLRVHHSNNFLYPMASSASVSEVSVPPRDAIQSKTYVHSNEFSQNIPQHPCVTNCSPGA